MCKCVPTAPAVVTDESEGPNSNTAENWHSLQDPLWKLFQSLHWSDQQDIKALPHRIKDSLCAPSQHMMEDAQTIQWEDVEVVNHNLQYFQRCTIKACHIQTKQHKMTALFRQCTMLSSTYHTHMHPTDHWLSHCMCLAPLCPHIVVTCGSIDHLFHFNLTGFITCNA